MKRSTTQLSVTGSEEHPSAADLAWLARGGAKRKGRTRELISRYAHESYVSREELNVLTVFRGRHTHEHQNAFVCQGKHFAQVRKSKKKLKNKTETEEQGTKNTELEEILMQALCIWYTSTIREHACPGDPLQACA